MDSVIHAAVEEICSQLQNGLTLPALWPRLQPVLSSSNLDLSPGVKRAIWANLLRIPTLRFEVQKESYSPGDPSIQSFEDAEKLNLRIVSQRNLRDNFVGLYESNPLAPNQMRVLELLANARFVNLPRIDPLYYVLVWISFVCMRLNALACTFAADVWLCLELVFLWGKKNWSLTWRKLIILHDLIFARYYNA